DDLRRRCDLDAVPERCRELIETPRDRLGAADEQRVELAAIAQGLQRAGDALLRPAITAHHVDGDGRHANTARLARDGALPSASPCGYSCSSASAGFSMTRRPR